MVSASTRRLPSTTIELTVCATATPEDAIVAQPACIGPAGRAADLDLIPVAAPVEDLGVISVEQLADHPAYELVGVGVSVGSMVGVELGVGDCVNVGVFVAVGVLVGVLVEVLVGGEVGVAVGVLVGVAGLGVGLM